MRVSCTGFPTDLTAGVLVRETARIRYGVVSVVYGDEFTRVMTDVTLPTNLSPGNLPGLAERAEVTFHIYASHASQMALRAAPVFPTLERYARVEFHDIGSEQIARANTPYEVLQQCHAQAIAVARERDEALVVLSPDAIWSDGSFTRMHELAEEGARAVMMAAPRAHKQRFLEALPGHSQAADDGSLRVDSRALMSCLIGNLHPYSDNLFWREDRLSSWPSQLFWSAGQHGMLVRAFHLHPLLVRPMEWDAAMPETIDGRFVAAAVPDPAKIHVVRDSDEIAACEMTDQLASRVHLATPNRDSGARRVAAWMRRETDALHRRYADVPIRLHGGDDGDDERAAFDRAEAESERVMTRIRRDYRALQAGSPERSMGGQSHVASQS